MHINELAQREQVTFKLVRTSHKGNLVMMSGWQLIDHGRSEGGSGRAHETRVEAIVNPNTHEVLHYEIQAGDEYDY